MIYLLYKIIGQANFYYACVIKLKLFNNNFSWFYHLQKLIYIPVLKFNADIVWDV